MDNMTNQKFLSPMFPKKQFVQGKQNSSFFDNFIRKQLDMVQ